MLEKEKEVRRLIGFGYFDSVIAGRLGLTEKEVHAIRDKIQENKRK